MSIHRLHEKFLHVHLVTFMYALSDHPVLIAAIAPLCREALLPLSPNRGMGSHWD